MRWRKPSKSVYHSLGSFRLRYGLVDAVSTGPATTEEMEAARAKYGNPSTVEQWDAAVASRRKLDAVVDDRRRGEHHQGGKK